MSFEINSFKFFDNFENPAIISRNPNLTNFKPYSGPTALHQATIWDHAEVQKKNASTTNHRRQVVNVLLDRGAQLLEDVRDKFWNKRNPFFMLDRIENNSTKLITWLKLPSRIESKTIRCGDHSL